MFWLTLGLMIICIILFLGLIISLNKNLDQLSTIENVAQIIQENVDHLQSIYERVQAKTKLEVMSDDPIVRELVNDIRDARDTMKFVLDEMNVLAKLDDEYEEEEQ